MKLKKRHYEIAIGLVLLAGAIVGVIYGAGVFDDSQAVKTQKAFDAAVAEVPPRDNACPIISPGKRLVEYFPSQQTACSSVTEGVTHVVFTYADLNTKSFQLADINIVKCIAELRKRCIYVLGGIGGDKPFDSNTVATKATELVQKFKLDGISVHDVKTTTGSTLPYMASLSKNLKSINALLSYDVYYSELDTEKLNCGTRCFSEGVESVVDWVTVMAYSVSDDIFEARSIYEAAINGTFESWKKKLTPSKLNIGVCLDCGYGPGPEADDISMWATYSQSAGGMSVYGTVDSMYHAIQSIFIPIPIQPRSNGTNSSAVLCASPSNTRVVEFWGSEVSGCDTIPERVTHVIMSFALVKDGLVSLSLQGNDATLKRCVYILQKRCIQVLVSVGGESNNKEFAAITDYNAFATSVVTLVDKFKFDGVDVDDENKLTGYDSSHVLKYMTALSSQLKPKGKLLTMDSFMFDVDPKKCSDVVGRCFPSGVESLVDWVHVMAYNIYDDKELAEGVYSTATTDIFPQWTKLLGPSKTVVSVCTESVDPKYRGCSYGPGPSQETVASWTKWSKTSASGMSLWSGSKDQFLNYMWTKLIIGN